MWYVIQTVSGREKHARDLVRKLVAAELFEEVFIPQYEIKKRIGRTWRTCIEVLFPGYLFVVTDRPGELDAALRVVPTFSKLLGGNDMFTPLDDRETAFVNALTKPESRVIEFSNGVIEGDAIVILDGALKHQTGLIKKVDRHKRLAYLEIEMFGRKKTVKVGLEIVGKRP